MKYEDFDIEDFIADEFFISWIKRDSKEANLFWQSWIAEHPNKLPLIQKAREIILSIQPVREKPSQKDYTEVLEGILRPKSQVFLNKEKKGKKNWNYAASITLLLGMLGWVFWFKIEAPVNIEEAAVVSPLLKREIPKGQKSTIMLSDGTKVKLNAGASFEFPERFEDNQKREVFLSGEAFFEVTKDTLRPFIIKSKNVTTRVLGTSFNLNEKNGDVAVTVVTGKVKVYNSKGTSTDAVYLIPGEQASYVSKSGNITKKKVDIAPVTAWKDDVIYFYHSDFNEVVERLERWYGIKVIVHRKIAGKFSGRFKSKSLKDVLNGLSYTSSFDFEIENKTVNIF